MFSDSAAYSLESVYYLFILHFPMWLMYITSSTSNVCYAVLQTKLERMHFDKFAVMRISKHIISAPRLWKCQ